MKDKRKTKEQLINELAELRQRIAELEASETDRKRADRAIQEAREYAESIVDTVREPLVVLEADTRVISANRSFYQTFKVTPEETKGQRIYDLGNRQWDIPKLRELLEETLPKNVTFDDFEVEHEFLTIGRRTMLLNARQILGEANKTQMILLAIEDITERKRAEEGLKQALAELERSNKELEQFAYVASHDMQEPLRKVQTFGDWLEAKYAQALDDQGRDYLERMQDAARRMQTMINDLLTFSRVTTRVRPFAPLDLRQVAHEALSDLEVRIEQTGGRVKIGDLPTIEADPTQMRQLLENLIGNSLKFHREGVAPVVEITSKRIDGREGELCQVFVKDNGIGFDEKYLDRLFQPFQRLHGRGKYEGTGIGLAICRKIAERHGGRITAQSAPGRGATFIVTLPVNQGVGIRE